MKNRKYSIATFLFTLLISPFYVYSQYSVPYVETYEKCNYCGETRQHTPHVYDDNGLTKSVNECAFYYLKNSQKGSVVFESLFGTPVSNQCGKSSTGDHYWVKKSEKKYFQLTADKIKSCNDKNEKAKTDEKNTESKKQMDWCENNYYVKLNSYLDAQADKINLFLYYYITGQKKDIKELYTVTPWQSLDNLIVDKNFNLIVNKQDVLERLYLTSKDVGFTFNFQYNLNDINQCQKLNQNQIETLSLLSEFNLGKDYYFGTKKYGGYAFDQYRKIKKYNATEEKLSQKMQSYFYNDAALKFFTINFDIKLLYAMQLYNKGDHQKSFDILNQLLDKSDIYQENRKDLYVTQEYYRFCDDFNNVSYMTAFNNKEGFLGKYPNAWNKNDMLYVDVYSKANAYIVYMALCKEKNIETDLLKNVCTEILSRQDKILLLAYSTYNSNVYNSTLQAYGSEWSTKIKNSICASNNSTIYVQDFERSYGSPLPKNFAKLYFNRNYDKGTSNELYNLACIASLKGSPQRAIDYLKYWMYLMYNKSKQENVDNELLNLTKDEDLKNLANFKEFKQILEWVNGFKNLDSDKKFQTNIVKIYQD